MRPVTVIAAVLWTVSACVRQQTHSCVMPALHPRVEADTLRRQAIAARMVRGVVIDRESNQPISDAYVRLEPGAKRQRSDSAGRFQFVEVPPGSYTLDALAIGWRMQPRSIRTTPESGTHAVLVLNRDTTPGTCVTTAAGPR